MSSQGGNAAKDVSLVAEIAVSYIEGEQAFFFVFFFSNAPPHHLSS